MKHPENQDGTLRSFIESVQDYAIFLLDQQGNVSTWNRGAERIKQYTAQEIIGAHFSKFYTPEDVLHEKPWRALEIAARTGKYEEEGWRLRKDGTRFWVSVILTAIYDSANKVIGYGKVVRDLTERRLAEEALRNSEERYRSLVSNVKEYAILILDPQGDISSWNAGAERMNGYSPNEIIGRNFSLFYTPEDLAANKPKHELELALAKGKYEEEGWRVRKNGSQFLARVLITPLRDSRGNLLGYTKITRDITDEKEKEQIGEALRMRDLFLSVITHELRTPITSVRLQTDTLKRILERRQLNSDELLERLLRYFRMNDMQTERLNKLVNDLLEFSRVNTSDLRLDKEPLDFNKLIQDTAEGFELSAEQAGSKLQFELTPNIQGCWDKIRLEQVISNLLTNAIRHASQAPITLVSRLEGNEAVFEVNDGGPGIPDAEIEAVMQPFVQANKTSALGLGIGLFITRKIVLQHGGSINLANRTPRGLSVTVRLPLAASGEAEPSGS